MTDLDKEPRLNPTTIITGFLGAGKTTFLNAILDKNSDEKYAIIENEFGEKSIDSDLIMRGGDNIVELNNGCLCCTLNEDLYEILNELYTKRFEFEELIIEATGVADPRGLAAPFITNPPIKKQFPLRQVICIVDASLIEARLEETEEALHQITFSDTLYINKVDLVDAVTLDRVQQKLRQINPLSKIVLRSDEGHLDFFKASPRLMETLEQVQESKSDKFRADQGETHEHKHTKGIKSLSMTFDQPFDLAKLRLRLHVFLTFQSAGLFRMKGILWFNDSDEKFVLQSVGKQMSIDSLGEWQEGEKQSTIVLIGKDLTREGLEKMFSQCF